MAFFALKHWITVPAASERRYRENLVERTEESHLWTLQRPQAAPGPLSWPAQCFMGMVRTCDG